MPSRARLVSEKNPRQEGGGTLEGLVNDDTAILALELGRELAVQ